MAGPSKTHQEATRATPSPRDAGYHAAASVEAEIARLRGQVDDLGRALEHQERLATLGTIAGLIAHEFNNILTPVCSYAQMALDAPGDAALATKALERALAGSERAARIAGAILGFVRDEDVVGGLDSLRPAPQAPPCSTWNLPTTSEPGRTAASCEVGVAIDEALACMGRDLGRDGITLIRDVPTGMQAAIRPIALQHVMLNLILNARQAMLKPSAGVGGRGAGAKLIIRAEKVNSPPRREPGEVSGCDSDKRGVAGQERRRGGCSTWNTGGGGCVVIEISDSGRGMSPAELEHVFTPFFTRTIATPGERRGGTGLGMTVCKRLVEDACGDISITSQPGRGTRVRVLLHSLDA